MKHTHSTRIYLISILVLALAVPAAALAAPGGGSGKATQRAGLAPARPVLAPLTGPVQRFHHAIRVGLHRIHVARHRRAVQRRHQEAEAFSSLPGGVSLATLDAIAACESGGDPTAVSAGGTYRGKYQFDYGTWESVGGTGDPAAAPEQEQDYRAALLYERAGSSPWPVCG